MMTGLPRDEDPSPQPPARPGAEGGRSNRAGAPAAAGPDGPDTADDVLDELEERDAARSGGPSLTVAAVARRLGVAPATLRTWDRRYGLGPSEHLAGSHRRYSAADVARLLVMRRLTLEGVAPSEAARSALDSTDSGVPDVHVPSASEIMDAFSDAVPMAPDPAALVAAAAHFDNAAVRWMLARVHPRDVVAWWTDLVQPALRDLHGRAVLEMPGECAAPALTAAAFAELRSRAAVAATRPPTQREGSEAAVLAIPVGHPPDLLVHVLAAALQAQGVQARVLADGRPPAVTHAIGVLGPQAVVLDVGPPGTTAGPTAADVVEAVAAAAPGIPVFVHRSGASSEDLPSAPGVHRVRTLTGALHEIVAVVG